ncbi:hypothetical protein A1OO_08645 [Enterovibrio norvegicus FF-33]|nr:hypothetical protein A1OO_08645 [Enterovibrio norvegicus FF-33]
MVLMSTEYGKMIGQTYNQLMKQAHFASLSGGNVPRDVDPAFDTFFVTSKSNNVSFVFDRQTNTLIGIEVKPNQVGALPLGITVNMKSNEVTDLLGQPTAAMPAKKVPVLGLVGAWERFNVSGDTVLVVYDPESENVSQLRYEQPSCG